MKLPTYSIPNEPTHLKLVTGIGARISQLFWQQTIKGGVISIRLSTSITMQFTAVIYLALCEERNNKTSGAGACGSYAGGYK